MGAAGGRALVSLNPSPSTPRPCLPGACPRVLGGPAAAPPNLGCSDQPILALGHCSPALGLEEPCAVPVPGVRGGGVGGGGGGVSLRAAPRLPLLEGSEERA